MLLGLFGSSSVAAGLLTLLLPETTERRLPESLADGEAFPDSPPRLPCLPGEGGGGGLRIGGLAM